MVYIVFCVAFLALENAALYTACRVYIGNNEIICFSCWKLVKGLQWLDTITVLYEEKVL